MKITLNRRPGASSYTDQIATHLSGQIKRGNYGKGALLPSERELAAAAGVARNVVRNAYTRLEDQGLIKHVGRKGRVVQGPSKHRK